jgi:hypothetical protein
MIHMIYSILLKVISGKTGRLNKSICTYSRQVQQNVCTAKMMELVDMLGLGSSS